MFRYQNGRKSKPHSNGKKPMLCRSVNQNRPIPCSHRPAMKFDIFAFHRQRTLHAAPVIHCSASRRDALVRHLRYQVWPTAQPMRMRMRKVGFELIICLFKLLLLLFPISFSTVYFSDFSCFSPRLFLLFVEEDEEIICT